MILPVLQYPDPRLARKALDVKTVTPEIRELVQDMVETMYARDGVGLAATQVGKLLRLVVIDISGPAVREQLMVLVNPTLTLAGEKMDAEEACLSVPDFRSTVTRYAKARIDATDLDGNPITLDTEELLAVCVQHECDHLDGTLFIDHISRLKRMVYDRKIDKKKKA